MNTESSQKDYFITPEQLSVGLFVFIDLPWFSHPFSFNSFKIRSNDQIQTLRGLGVKRFRYDPDRSDAPQFPAAAMATVEPVATTAEASLPESADAADPALAAKRERVERLREQRVRMGNVEKAFVKAASIMRNINRNLQARPKECIEEIGELVQQMAQAFLEAPELTLHVMGEKAGGEEVYYHGLNTSILSMMLARDMGMAMEEGKVLGLGALMHDIGLIEIPDRVLKKTDELTHAESELRKLHCEYGVRIGQKAGLPGSVLSIIFQHHEMADGTGYPKGLKGETIHPLARIVSLANYYDNLCNPVNTAKALTPHEALSLMFAQRRAKFDAKVLQILIKNLGVYPPGSIVKLSNDALALVQSVNPQKPLRPWVVVYDPDVPKEEAIMLDLEQEPDINISKAIRPGQLPAEVFRYLSPRTRVTYFFDADSRGGGGRS
ncbi:MULTISPECIES: HD-GYP domain-containing protein [unclassified Uliginosibacterium]|uniref:HD-GYP domain-containing protein n=1 Tax=unclassified Uliginosibacterium TaxID=2621521 RepID=UPI000C7C4D44|nr:MULTISPECIES: HD-GYP domain-containing protein [unclassified Uliginosibacterium]MDO6386554.1 HD-GYP domain-containing protein [Uliginosibacterium sp. 31-12]PLK50392.1 metal-dependent phosphohydrolase [Uliginosibacterium sp. TH139]